MSEAIQVVTTVATEEAAAALAAALVERRLAACVQVWGPIRSVYRWAGAVESAEEWVCQIKTLAWRFPALEEAIQELHAYDVPEILATPVVAGSEAYLAWLRAGVSEPAAGLPG